MAKEEILLSGLQDGSESAYRRLFDTYGNKVFNTLLSMVQNREEAEELTQDVFLEVFQSIDDFRKDAKLYTWIYRISIRKALDHLKYKKRKKRFAFLTSIFDKESGEMTVQAPDFVHPGVLMEQQERSSVLFKAIDRLPPQQKAAFTLHKVEELSYQEISEVLQVSVSAVESLMHRAKQNLQKLLKNYYESQKESRF